MGKKLAALGLAFAMIAAVAITVAPALAIQFPVYVPGLTSGRVTAPTASVGVPAPTTAAGYERLWKSIDPAYWGSADVSLSVPMADGRVVWLYGDTMSDRHGMVNSTAITQTGGSLHVSSQGAQLLPSAGENSLGQKIVYWIEEARAISRTEIEITAAPIWIGDLNRFDFGRADAKSRTALVRVDKLGDVRFERWTGWVTPPVQDTRFLGVFDGAPDQIEGHLYYGKRRHPQAKLASGRTLVTICQNRSFVALTPAGKIDYSQYRVIFTKE